MNPALPFIEVHTRPPHQPLDPSEPIVTLQRDSAGRWWHTVAGEVVREATWAETLLPLSVETWLKLGTPTRAAPQG